MTELRHIHLEGTADYTAALDCGTNSTRLLICDGDGRTVERLMTITRLGQGVDATGALDEAAIIRVLTALSTYRAVMDRHRVQRCRMVFTSAVRDASNGAAFLDRASEVVGCAAEVLTGNDEAVLSFAGATADLDRAEAATLVVDIGGGSTELVLETDGGLEAVSLQLGCVRLTERCLHGDPPTQAELHAARSVIAQQFERIAPALPSLTAFEHVRVVGLAGTVASLVLLEERLTTYSRDQVHHQRVPRSVVEQWIDVLSSETLEQRLAYRGMEAGRADVLLGGLLVLEAVLELVGAASLLTSESDILDGLAASLR